ncbi:hypothetical protein BUALT_Bualt02G0213800 [Buddleja alternifolia]|uniref:hAT-like transposase RNase-H fold domain-containing protein n=1 Tax=Buddleja alternifolia TaxID=168488 RepID=A0AAV6Y497_9LAMI|nr:hypothetical protein BUALT_Bualt02G0213800 [Buddleja alternifolia]
MNMGQENEMDDEEVDIEEPSPRTTKRKIGNMNIGTPGDTSSRPIPSVADSTSPDYMDPSINEQVDDIENTDTISTDDDVQKPKRTKTSHVWKHFEEGKDQDGSIQFFLQALADALENRESLTQSHISFPTSSVDPLSVPAFDGKFDKEMVKVDVAKWITIHKYAFSAVEDEWYNIMMKRNNPEWMPISRTTIRNQCVRIYENWGIEGKIHTVSVDNASANDSAIENLKVFIRSKKKLFCDGSVFHVRCCAHILNLVAQDGLSKIKNVIECVRDSVDYIRRSDSRLKIFTEIVKQLNLRERKLIDDCKTRWNSTYEMLAIAIKFRDVFPRYTDRDPCYLDCPSPSDWEKVVKVCSLLEVFWKATHVISGNYYPTSNLFLQEVVRVKVELDSKSQSSDDFIYDMVNSMKRKFDKYWGKSNLLMAIAAVLDPRYKMMALEFFFPKLYSPEKAATELAFVRRILYDLYSEYVSMCSAESNASGEGSMSCQSTNSDRNVETRTLLSELASFLKEKQSVQPQKSEVDILSADSVELLMCGLDWLRKRHGLKKKSQEEKKPVPIFLPIDDDASKG